MKKPTHILVLRLSALGDVAMLVPVLHILTQTYPNLKITVVSRAFFKPFFKDISNCNFLEADVYGKHKGFGLFKLSSEAKKLGIDAVADVHNVLRSKMLRTHLWSMGIKTATIDKGRAEKKKATASKPLKKLQPLKTTHQRYAAVFSMLGYPIDLKKYTPPRNKELSEKTHNLIGAHTQKLIGIAPFAAYKSKMYPLPMMREVLEKLNAQKNYQLLLFGGKNEVKQMEEISAGLQNVKVVAGSLSFEEELALISNLDGMIAMDSGNGHLAAMFGVPVLTLWGVTHPYLGFTPFNQPRENQLISNREKYPLLPTSVYGNKYPKGYENAMQSIPVKLVVEKAVAVF
ncbi:glycosyltransferase family 9 protein [Patiriisocius hiemis]|uniref:Glycosyltransferase family 9 protein n=1 Tax=Patiriisocius hiemis TaxID=3075604 RepID=A0ABU2YCE6_9FLAO|nr:glycosyltransferase family 9 protein [Constantimarinum sp. W242]MDT0555551.1 glycosyltransferase family 9 protein [Constantimarinum sp. W242]